MLIVAGLTIKNLHPRVWDSTSPYYLSDLRAVMVSYAEFHQMPARRHQAMQLGLRVYLDLDERVAVYLDNGAFQFLNKGGEVPRVEYEAFVHAARPDWYAVPQDYIPTPSMTDTEQLECLRRTMEVNRSYRHDGYVPIVHASPHLDTYLNQLQSDERLRGKPRVGLGGLVPNLLRAPKAVPYANVLQSMRQVRARLADQQVHVFGIGGTATLHLAALLGMNSIDSSGWRNRAARGLVQLSGRGDRIVAELGNWRGRRVDKAEEVLLDACRCPACRQFGLDGLRASGTHGFCNRATHNLWTLLQESQQVADHLAAGTYVTWYGRHLQNSIYLPLVQRAASDLPKR
ncbi:MAG: hypothetical protein ACRDI2_22640 [Chloroflexota bacterium]